MHAHDCLGHLPVTGKQLITLVLWLRSLLYSACEHRCSLRHWRSLQNQISAPCLAHLECWVPPACTLFGSTSQARLPSHSRRSPVGISQGGKRHCIWKPLQSVPSFPCFFSSLSPPLYFLLYLSLINSYAKNQAAWERHRVLRRVSFTWACVG